jgi:bifunctional non-homologous end joining protein LigD
VSARRAEELTTAWPTLVRPMLATPGDVPTEPGWGYEFKWDGVRAIAYVAGDEVRLMSRNDLDITRCYPELGDLAALLGGHRAVLDGEIVSLDRAGRPDFGLLQSRMHVQRPGPALLRRVPVAYFVFDLLHQDGDSLLPEPYRGRRERLAVLSLDGRSRSITVPRWWPGWPGDGEAVLAAAREHGLEGVVAKRLDSRYQPGRRSHSWVKTALTRTMDVVIGGWKVGEGNRSGTVGSLVVGAYDDDGRLRYLGHVGTGFTRRVLTDLYTRLSALETRSDPFHGDVPREHAREVRWVRPHLVAEVSYRGVTQDGRLRAASWRGLRPDKSPDEARRHLPPARSARTGESRSADHSGLSWRGNAQDAMVATRSARLPQAPSSWASRSFGTPPMSCSSEMGGLDWAAGSVRRHGTFRPSAPGRQSSRRPHQLRGPPARTGHGQAAVPRWPTGDPDRWGGHRQNPTGAAGGGTGRAGVSRRSMVGGTGRVGGR